MGAARSSKVQKFWPGYTKREEFSSNILPPCTD
jgi:hypothetical protein